MLHLIAESLFRVIKTDIIHFFWCLCWGSVCLCVLYYSSVGNSYWIETSPDEALDFVIGKAFSLPVAELLLQIATNKMPPSAFFLLLLVRVYKQIEECINSVRKYHSGTIAHVFAQVQGWVNIYLKLTAYPVKVEHIRAKM